MVFTDLVLIACAVDCNGICVDIIQAYEPPMWFVLNHGTGAIMQIWGSCPSLDDIRGP